MRYLAGALLLTVMSAAGLHGQAVTAGNADPAGTWPCQLSTGANDWANITVGPVTAVFAGQRLEGRHGCGGLVHLSSAVTGFGECLCGFTHTETTKAIRLNFRGRSFEVRKPGTALVVDGKTYPLDATQRTTVRFERGRATVTQEAAGAP